MKKLFLAVALVAASLSAGALTSPTYTFFAPNSVTENGTAVTADVTLTSGNSATFVSTATGGSGTLTYVTTSTSAPSYNYKTTNSAFHIYGNAGTTSADSVQLYSRFTIPNKSTFTLGAFTTTGGNLTVHYAPNGTTTRGITVSVNGTVVLTSAPASYTTKYEYVSASTPLAAGTYAAGTVVITGYTNTILLYGIDIDGVTLGIKDAISSDILKKTGDALVNPTALSVDVYSVTGVKALTSNKTSINVSALPQGVYVAKTAKGTLKFIK
ncbi:MAG: hypothetical protein P4L28_01285 [Paludibacteraceae bacterium]|nr:hypothetical protein [Paludibacteraceae bacterium]